jgi:hypothetical protein
MEAVQEIFDLIHMLLDRNWNAVGSPATAADTSGLMEKRGRFAFGQHQRKLQRDAD